MSNRYKTEKQILDFIEREKVRALEILQRAEDFEHEAKIESKIPLIVEDARFKFAEAKKLRRSYENIMERKIKKLVQKLAQFRTVPCAFIDGRPGIGDASVSTRLSAL